MSKSKGKTQINQTVNTERVKYFISALDTKADANMTRIYAAIYSSDFFNTTVKSKAK